MVNPNANDSTTKRKAGRDSSRLKTRESPRHNTHHRGVSVSRDSRTDEVCERMPLLRILTCLLGFYAEARILADHQPMDSTLLVGNRSRVGIAMIHARYLTTKARPARSGWRSRRRDERHPEVRRSFPRP